MSLLMISDITAAYGKAIVLQNLSLKVAEGEICALLGSNGSGKTTLIKTILGMVKATAGRIEFDGKPIRIQLHFVGLDFGKIEKIIDQGQ